MNNQRILFEYSPAFIPLCLTLGLGYAFILYRTKHSWNLRMNRLLFALRAVLVSFIAFLLIGPILKLTHNLIEKPTLVVLVDNSLSVKETIDSVKRQKIKRDIEGVKNSLQEGGYDVRMRSLSGDENSFPNFNSKTSDLTGSLREIVADYEGKNLAGLVLLSDGIYNSGASPLYLPLRIPMFTVGLGDTTQRIDLALRNLAFNKIAYQGNQFPLRAEVLLEGLTNQAVNVSVFQGGKLVSQQTKNSGSKPLLDFDFQLNAKEKGLQRIDVAVEPLSAERNKKNNHATAFVEVVEGKKKILMIAPAPHPDIKAFREVVEKNSNYEFIVHIPGVKEAPAAALQPGKADLIIFDQVMDIQGKTAALFASLSKASASMLLIIGTGSNIRQLPSAGIPITFDKTGQWDDVTPLINPAFRDFGFSDNSNGIFSQYPPASVPFGRFGYPVNASVLLFQQIGSIPTERPMLLTFDENGRKTGILMAEGVWRWRMNEFSRSEKTEAFDEVFSKLIQYLSTRDDQRKFRCYPIQNEFIDDGPVVFESQVYNELFEQVFGNTINLDIRDAQGKTTSYSYVTSVGGSRYRIGGLKEGVYQYKGSTQLNGKREEIRGEFLVKAQNIESQNLIADFGLLRKLSANSGGKFYPSESLSSLQSDLSKVKARGLIHSEESFNPLINLKWVFFLLLLLVSSEWFLRKFLGGL